MSRALCITAPHFVAAVELNENGVVVNAAPIVRYMQSGAWTEQLVRAYCARKGWAIEESEA